MKIKSYIKAILSGLVWGLGQLFNRQYFKALFFFIFFVAFVGIELSTSKYFYEETKENEIAFNKLPGKDLGDSLYPNLISHHAVYSVLYPNTKDENFVLFLEEIGVQFEDRGGFYLPINKTEELFTENRAIEYFVREFQKSSPSSYTNLNTGDNILAEDFLVEDYFNIKTKETIYYDEENKTFYFQREYKDENENQKFEYIETDLFINAIKEDPKKLDSSEGMQRIDKTNSFYYNNTSKTYYLDADFYSVDSEGKTIKTTETIQINLDNELIFAPDKSDFESNKYPLVAKTILGPMYMNDSGVFEYYQPELVHNGVRLQYKNIPIMDSFKTLMSNPQGPLVQGEYTSTDYERLMLKVMFELNPEIKAEYLSVYYNSFYDRAGLFVKGYWSLITLGVAQRQNYTSYMALYDAMIGLPNTPNSLSSLVSLTESVPIQGHVSTMLLIESLIAVILSLFFFVFLFWSVRDAYKISEQKRMDEEVDGDKEYFKSVWDNSFEYIILSPALFVLAFISIMPIAFGFILAFTSISGNQSMVDNFNYVGLRNFLALFNFSSGLGSSFGVAFWNVLWWTIIWAVFSTATVFFGGFIQALILNSEKVVFRKFWRTILILPWAIPALLSQMVFSVIFNENGFVNELLQNIGVYNVLQNIGILGKPFSEMSGVLKYFWLGNRNIQWFTNPHNTAFVKVTLIVVNIWLGFPYFMALMTGIMTAIDKHLYEAADIDGATGFQKITKITVPLVLYSTAPILIMTFSGNFNNFGVIYFITGGGPNAGLASRGYAGSTDILISWMYSLTVDYSIYNMASVFSVLVFIVVGSVTAWNLTKTRAFQED